MRNEESWVSLSNVRHFITIGVNMWLSPFVLIYFLLVFQSVGLFQLHSGFLFRRIDSYIDVYSMYLWEVD
jgi:hypothetical protein